MFQNYIDRILTSWHALQFAVKQQTGGRESYAISKWMNEVTEKFFHDNDDLEPDEVAEFLSTIMDQELNTLVDDGSDLEISQILCEVYESHKKGNMNDIQNILSKLPNNEHLECEMQSESDAENEVQACQVSSQISSLNLSENLSKSETDAPLNSGTSHNEPDEDGWLTVNRGKRKDR